MTQFIGIDFGSTNTSVALVRVNEQGREITPLYDEEDSPFTSIVAIPKEGGDILFGRHVRKNRLNYANTHDVYTSMKPYLGKKMEDGSPFSIETNSSRFYPKAIVTAFFEHIKTHVMKRYNIEIKSAALTFPADFDSDARRELREAAINAGISVDVFINESTCAYFASYDVCKTFSKVMVLDWGGGTFDVSILDVQRPIVREIAVWGEHIGGDDIDLQFAERVHSLIYDISGNANGRSFDKMTHAERDQLLSKSELAKIQISYDDEDYPLLVIEYGEYGTMTVSVSPDMLNDIVNSIVKTKVLSAIDKALGIAGGLDPGLIDCVLIVGGSSNLDVYEKHITKHFSNAEIILPDKSQWSTAIGAALLQMAGGRFRLSDSVGVLLSDDTVFTVLPKGAVVNEKTLPVKFALIEDSTEAHFIFTNETGKKVYGKYNVPTKGFFKEKLELMAEIDENMISRVHVRVESFGSGQQGSSTLEIGNLNFHYELGSLDE